MRDNKMSKIKEFYISPDLGNDDLTKSIDCFNETGEQIKLPVVTEIPLTIYLNKQEIVTAMTLGDMPELLAVGYLLNQKMLKSEDIISEINYDKDLQVVVVRTDRKTNYEKKMEKKIRTSGCAVGTVYGDIMDDFSSINLDKNSKIKTSWIYTISKKINTRPSLYLKAGALHGCVLCKNDSPLIYVEDVGRHNAVDKIAGWMFLNKETANDKFFYTTGRLTSEMVIKTVQMGIPILISRSGFTASGVELAKEAGLTLIGRAKGKRIIIANGIERVVFDTNVNEIKNEELISAQRFLVN
jgi:FdhD protein